MWVFFGLMPLLFAMYAAILPFVPLSIAKDEIEKLMKKIEAMIAEKGDIN